MQRLGGGDPPLLRVTTGNCQLHAREQISAVIDDVFVWIKATDQERGDAEIVVVKQRLGHLARRADQRRGVAARTGEAR